MRMLFQSMLLLLLPLATLADESDRRAFFSPDGRVQKFQTAESIYPVRKVNAGPDVWTLPKSSKAGNFSPSYVFGDAKYGIDEFNERTKTNALLVLKDGEIVYERYLNGSKPATRFVSFSTGKSFTSTVVGIAIEEGLIKGVNEPMVRHLPSLTGSAYDGNTFRDALQMVSGVEWDELAYDWADESQPLVRLWNQSYVEQRYRFVEGANTLRRAHPPGQHYNYNTMETSLLGWAVENAANRRFSRYFEEKIWQPAGMEFDAAWILDGPEDIGREMTGGGLLAALRDFGRFGQLMANAGRGNGRQIVSADWVRAATTPDRDAIQYGKLYDGYPLGYGYQWWLFDNGRFEAVGVYGQFIYVAPEENVVIVKLSYWPEAWVEDMEYETYAFFDAVVDALR